MSHFSSSVYCLLGITRLRDLDAAKAWVPSANGIACKLALPLNCTQLDALGSLGAIYGPLKKLIRCYIQRKSLINIIDPKP